MSFHLIFISLSSSFPYSFVNSPVVCEASYSNVLDMWIEMKSLFFLVYDAWCSFLYCCTLLVAGQGNERIHFMPKWHTPSVIKSNNMRFDEILMRIVEKKHIFSKLTAPFFPFALNFDD